MSGLSGPSQSMDVDPIPSFEDMSIVDIPSSTFLSVAPANPGTDTRHSILPGPNPRKRKAEAEPHEGEPKGEKRTVTFGAFQSGSRWQHRMSTTTPRLDDVPQGNGGDAPPDINGTSQVRSVALSNTGVLAFVPRTVGRTRCGCCLTTVASSRLLVGVFWDNAKTIPVSIFRSCAESDAHSKLITTTKAKRMYRTRHFKSLIKPVFTSGCGHKRGRGPKIRTYSELQVVALNERVPAAEGEYRRRFYESLVKSDVFVRSRNSKKILRKFMNGKFGKQDDNALNKAVREAVRKHQANLSFSNTCRGHARESEEAIPGGSQRMEEEDDYEGVDDEDIDEGVEEEDVYEQIEREEDVYEQMEGEYVYEQMEVEDVYERTEEEDVCERMEEADVCGDGCHSE